MRDRKAWGFWWMISLWSTGYLGPQGRPRSQERSPVEKPTVLYQGTLKHAALVERLNPSPTTGTVAMAEPVLGSSTQAVTGAERHGKDIRNRDEHTVCQPNLPVDDSGWMGCLVPPHLDRSGAKVWAAPVDSS